MPTSTSSGNERDSIDDLALRIRESEAQAASPKENWKSLKIQIATTPPINLADIATKRCIIRDALQTAADKIDLDILNSAIRDLQLLSKTAGDP